MPLDHVVRRIQTAYPRIYLACHVEHRPSSRRGAALSDKDSRILAHLDGVEPVSAADLARHLAIRPSTLSEALDRLVDRGLVSRQTRADDRRRVDLRLTGPGTDAMQQSSVLDTTRLARLLERLSDTEREQAAAGLELLAAAASRASDDRSV